MVLSITPENIAELIASGKTKSEAAAFFNVCPRTFNRYLQSSGLHYPKSSRRTNSRVEADVDSLVSHIVQFGGSIPQTARLLNLKTTVCTLRKKLKERGIDLSPYRLAHRIFGDWTVLPDPTNLSDGINVSCRCGGCGLVRPVSLHNLNNQRSLSCNKCAAQRKRNITVTSVDGTQSFNSIAEFVRALGLQDRYQTVRLKLNKSQQISVDNTTFISK